MSFLDQMEADPRWSSLDLGPRETLRALVRFAYFTSDAMCMGECNLAEIAGLRGCSVRTISREFRALRSAGILASERAHDPRTLRPSLIFFLYGWEEPFVTADGVGGEA